MGVDLCAQVGGLGEVAGSGVEAMEVSGFARQGGENGDGGGSCGVFKAPEVFGSGGGEGFERARKDRVYEVFFIEELSQLHVFGFTEDVLGLFGLLGLNFGLLALPVPDLLWRCPRNLKNKLLMLSPVFLQFNG